MASVVHFNRCARLVQRLGVELNFFMTNYFDDFPVVSPVSLGDSTMTSMTMLLKLLGFDYAEHKLKEFGGCASVLGVEVDVRALPGGAVTVRNEPSRIEEISKLIDETIASKVLTFKNASKLLGRIQYADSFVMGRDGRLAMHEIREHVKLADKQGALNNEACQSLSLLKGRLISGKPREVPWKIDVRPVLLFTDG